VFIRTCTQVFKRTCAHAYVQDLLLFTCLLLIYLFCIFIIMFICRFAFMMDPFINATFPIEWYNGDAMSNDELVFFLLFVREELDFVLW
jgi:hypothetical protein